MRAMGVKVKKRDPRISKIGLWPLRIPVQTDKAADFSENVEFADLREHEIALMLAGCLIVAVVLTRRARGSVPASFLSRS